jgi:hypothetical protein
MQQVGIVISGMLDGEMFHNELSCKEEKRINLQENREAQRLSEELICVLLFFVKLCFQSICFCRT